MPQHTYPPVTPLQVSSSCRRSRRPNWRLCPRCFQWRSPGQFPSTALACLACPQELPRTTDDLVSEVEWLVGTDHRERIAARLSLTTGALERRLYRAGRGDLVARLRVSA